MAAKKKKKAKETKSEHIQKATIQARHDFTDAEQISLSQEFAMEHNRIAELTSQMKSITGDFKAKIRMGESRADQLANKITNGYEMRPTEVRVEYDSKAGMKSYYNLETDEFIHKETMDPSDFQIRMPLEEEKPFNPVIADTPPAPLEEPVSPSEDEEEGKEVEL